MTERRKGHHGKHHGKHPSRHLSIPSAERNVSTADIWMMNIRALHKIFWARAHERVTVREVEAEIRQRVDTLRFLEVQGRSYNHSDLNNFLSRENARREIEGLQDTSKLFVRSPRISYG